MSKIVKKEILNLLKRWNQIVVRNNSWNLDYYFYNIVGELFKNSKKTTLKEFQKVLDFAKRIKFEVYYDMRRNIYYIK